MKISIIIPVYNVEKYILNCLQSVVNQIKTIHEIECIIVDDCCQDTSVDIAANFIKTYSGEIEFKILAHLHNRGLSAARNTGLNACTGDYVLFLDSDDTLPEDSICNLSKPLETFQYNFVLGEINTLGIKTISPTLYLNEGAYIGNDVARETYLNHKWYMMAWNKLCNTNFLKSHSLYFEEGLIHEDDLWSFALSLQTESFYVVRKPTYNYIIRIGSITTVRKQFVHIEAYLTIVNKIVDYIHKYSLCTDYILFCHQYVLGTYVYLRKLSVIDGYHAFEKIIHNKLYRDYIDVIQKKEIAKHAFKVKLATYPTILGYFIFRISFIITSIKDKVRKYVS